MLPDFSKLTAIRRFRDVCGERTGLPVDRMGREFYNRLALAAAEAREQVRRGVVTLDRWQAERRRLREVLAGLYHPAAPAALEIVEVGEIELPTVRVRRLLYAAAPDSWVPANLYLPKGIAGPLPGIVYIPGHAANGKRAYAERCVAVASHGYATIVYDPVGQGERQLIDPARAIYAASTQHDLLGARMVLTGANLMGMMIDDAMGAVSVLAAQPEVDAERIGATGSSGGGTLTVFAGALDERIKAMVPAASVHSQRFEAYADDAEQVQFALSARGLDYPDLLGFLVAPRPLQIIGNSRDIWSIASTEYACAEAGRLYELHGAGERLRMQVWDKGHAYEPDQLEVAMAWLDRWLGNRRPATATVKPAPGEVPAADQLGVTQTGSIYAEGRPHPAHGFRERAGRVIPPTPDLAGFLAWLKAAAAVPATTPWEELDRFAVGPWDGRRLAVTVDDRLLMPVEAFIPPAARGVAILLDETDRRDDLDWQLGVAAEGLVALRPDLRGWGEVSPPEDWADWEGWSRNRHGDRRERFWGMAHLAGRCLAVDRARDVRHLLNVAGALAPGLPLTIRGRREGAWIALLATLADERVAGLAVERYLTAWRDVLRHETPAFGVEGMVEGLLRWGVDVPELLAAVTCPLTATAPLDGLLRPMAVAASGR